MNPALQCGGSFAFRAIADLRFGNAFRKQVLTIETNTAGDSGQRRQDSPAFQERLVGRAHAEDLDHVIHDRKPDEAVIFRPLRLRRFECLGRIGTVTTSCEYRTSWLLPLVLRP